MPPDVEYRLTLALQANYVDVPERRVLYVEPSKGSNRFDYSLGVQEAFIDYHLGNVSDRYDFDSIRVGIQPFQFDFRGFLFQDQQLGVRCSATATTTASSTTWRRVWRLEKDTNSGLNNLFQRPRDDWILHANVFRQDFPIVSLTSQLSLTWNINRERDEIEIDDNGFPVRPALIGNLQARDYDVFYLGYSADGQIGRINLTASAYGPVRRGPEQHLHRAQGEYPRLLRRRRAVLRLQLDAGSAARPCSRAATAIRSTTSSAASTRSSRTRSSPAPTPATGSARPSRSPAAAARSRSTAATASSTRCARRRSRASPTSSIRARSCSAPAPISTSRPSSACRPTSTTSGSTGPRCCRRCGSQGTIRSDIGWDLSAAAIWRPERDQNVVFRLSGAAAPAGHRLPRPVHQQPRDRRYYSVLLNAILTY